MPICAYCESDSIGMTREHVWPRCIQERTKFELRFSGKAKKIVRNDLIVKDVCAKCNNETLSGLDSYFCDLYDAYFAHQLSTDQSVTLKYDFGKLSRSLLKLAYNSSRTTGQDQEALSKYAPVIAADAVPLGVFIKVATISPYESFDVKTGKWKTIPAMSARCGPFFVLGRHAAGLTSRMVQINAYRFYIIATDDLQNRSAAVRYLSNESGTWLSQAGETFVPCPTMSALQSFQGIENWRR